jgi:multicomponent K+:H+ antiporter subunit G
MNEAALPDAVALAAAVLLIIGGLAALLGACGMLRLRDFYQRMHPATLGATLGAGCMLLSSVLVSTAALGRPVIHEIVIVVFLVVTAPVSAITLMRAARSRTRTPPTEGGN